MIPIHYFLALFAILVSLMGCSQKAPPGSRQTLEFNNASKSQANEPRQTIHGNQDPTVRPSIIPSALTPTLELVQAGEWKLNFTGMDAKKLYGLMEVLPEIEMKDHHFSLVKHGAHYNCTRGKNYLCSFTLNSADGSLGKMKDSVEEGDFEVDFEPDLILTEKYTSPYFELDPPLSLGKYGRLNILGEDAQKIYESMSATSVSLKDDGMIHDRRGVQGKEVACYQETFGDAKEPSYKCNFFFNYNTGKFDEIQFL